jgi:hypothetical protein
MSIKQLLIDCAADYINAALIHADFDPLYDEQLVALQDPTESFAMLDDIADRVLANPDDPEIIEARQLLLHAHFLLNRK